VIHWSNRFPIKICYWVYFTSKAFTGGAECRPPKEKSQGLMTAIGCFIFFVSKGRAKNPQSGQSYTDRPVPFYCYFGECRKGFPPFPREGGFIKADCIGIVNVRSSVRGKVRDCNPVTNLANTPDSQDHLHKKT
jgi:hypothetical protein